MFILLFYDFPYVNYWTKEELSKRHAFRGRNQYYIYIHNVYNEEKSSAIFKFIFSAEDKSNENWEKIVRLGCYYHVEFSSQVISTHNES